MRGFIAGAVITLVVIVVVVIIYFGAGIAPAAVASQPMPFEKALANMALHARIRKEMPKSVPLELNERALLAGARVYADNCALCHALPDQPQSAIAQGMFPKPPQLFKGKGVTDDPLGESYWKIENGIRLSGMPSFKGNLTENQIWQVVLLVANADKLSPAVKQELSNSASRASN